MDTYEESKKKETKKRFKKDTTPMQEPKRIKGTNSGCNSSDSQYESRKKKSGLTTVSSKKSFDSNPYDNEPGEGHLCLQREGHMITKSLSLNTYSKSGKNAVHFPNTQIQTYDPSKNSRELNPYWKEGNRNGLPLQKEGMSVHKRNSSEKLFDHKNLQHKLQQHKEMEGTIKKEDKKSFEDQEYKKVLGTTGNAFLSDEAMNALGAKIIKAEILGNTELAQALKKNLESARAQRDRSQDVNKRSDSQRNVMKKQYGTVVSHYSGESNSSSFLNKFKPEKQITQQQLDLEYDELGTEHTTTVTDIFKNSLQKEVRKIRNRDSQQATKIYDDFNNSVINCDKCLESCKMDKELIVSMGSNCYLALPWHQGLQSEHCLIVPIHHAACSTELDENVWAEITNFRNNLTKMFYQRKMSVVFFELYKFINKHSHMVIHCIASKKLDLAPFYFKKAIEESEDDWSINKQLISLKDKNLINSIPKGLPYFWVHFGMDSGFAHVLEDQEKFPTNFAQEIIGKILNLNPSMWRKPRKEYNKVQKVKQLANWWKHYDCTANKNSN